MCRWNGRVRIEKICNSQKILAKGRIACRADGAVIADWVIPFAACQWAGQPQKLPFPLGCRSRPIHGYLSPPESTPKRHLDRFNHFCRAHACDQHTHRHTDHATYENCSNRPHLMHCVHAVRSNNVSISSSVKKSLSVQTNKRTNKQTVNHIIHTLPIGMCG